MLIFFNISSYEESRGQLNFPSVFRLCLLFLLYVACFHCSLQALFVLFSATVQKFNTSFLISELFKV